MALRKATSAVVAIGVDRRRVGGDDGIVGSSLVSKWI
jgi:hypothetical protein